MTDPAYEVIESAIDDMIEKLWFSATDEITVLEHHEAVARAYFRLGVTELFCKISDLPDPVLTRVMADLGLPHG